MKKKLEGMLFSLLLCAFSTTSVFAATLSLNYSGKNRSYTGKQLTFTYKGKAISTGKTPGLQINKVNMVPYYSVLVKKGPKVKRQYNKSTGRLKLTYGKKNILFYVDKKYAYTNGKKRKLTTAPLRVTYRSANTKIILIPAKFTAKYLGISYYYTKTAKRIDFSRPASVASYTSVNRSTNYNVSIGSYIASQKKSVSSYGGRSINYYNYVPITRDYTHNYQFLRLDTYRNVNSSTYNKLLNTYTGSSSVLRNKGNALISAAKSVNIDPVYFLCQSVLETGSGTSTLAKGKYTTKIISGKSVVRSNGVVVGFKKVNGKYITSSVKGKTVYNLYGIKAYDNGPQLCGFSYAYYMGWTSVDKAIKGAASYVSSNYIHNATYNQNTLYKFRFNPNVSYIYHQYATDPSYALQIGSIMYNRYRSAYANGVQMIYDKPVFK